MKEPQPLLGKRKGDGGGSRGIRRAAGNSDRGGRRQINGFAQQFLQQRPFVIGKLGAFFIQPGLLMGECFGGRRRSCVWLAGWRGRRRSGQRRPIQTTIGMAQNLADLNQISRQRSMPALLLQVETQGGNGGQHLTGVEEEVGD